MMAFNARAFTEILSVGEFLACARGFLKAPLPPRPSLLHFVIGNESADLDSICSAILCAYLQSYNLQSQEGSYTSNKSKFGVRDFIHIPIANIPRQDLRLRGELGPVLKCAGVSYDDVITVDEIPESLLPEQTRWTLVDHNVPVGVLGPGTALEPQQWLNGQLIERPSRVEAIFDHHIDEQRIRRGQDVSVRIIKTCGSCASIITEHFRSTWSNIASLSAATTHSSTAAPTGTTGSKAASQLAHFALAAILIDTTNLQSPDKTTDLDRSAVDFAEDMLQGNRSVGKVGDIDSVGINASAASESASSYSRTRLFDELTFLKQDCSTMTFCDMLRKDYKSTVVVSSSSVAAAGEQCKALKLGVSAIQRPFSYLLKPPASNVTADGGKPRIQGEGSFAHEFRKWVQDQNLDVAVVMTTGNNSNGEFQRELMVLGKGEQGASVVANFYDHNQESLKLRKYSEKECAPEFYNAISDLEAQVSHGGFGTAVVWNQHNLAESRKQVMPALRVAMEKYVAHGAQRI